MKLIRLFEHTALALGLAVRVGAGDVELELRHLNQEGVWVSFALPVAFNGQSNATGVSLFLEGMNRPVPGVRVLPILFRRAPGATGREVRSWLVQAPRVILGKARRVRVAWTQGPSISPAQPMNYSALRVESPEIVEVVDYAIEKREGEFRLVQNQPRRRVVLTGWEPPSLVIPPPGYLASSGLFGELMAAPDLAKSSRLAGLTFLSENLMLFGQAALYDEGYPASGYLGRAGEPGSAAVVDLARAYEAWLYDRCATFLLGFAHLGDVRFYRHALRACSFYASNIDDRGYFMLKTDKEGRATDAKYSHVRGLYLYYALTGDESALQAGRRIARMWLDEPYFVRPYRKGRARGPNKLWTERHLAHAFEALVYGFLLTEEPDLLAGARELFDAMWAHLTAPDSARLKAIMGHALPPQNCLVHASGQHEGWPPAEPFCSPWMSALLVDPLLRYQELTRDSRVDEVFVRFGRYLRDTGTVYFYGNPLGDTFFTPAKCYKPSPPGNPVRTLVPLYGAARRADGSRYALSRWDDFDHCADATALTAAALRALRRSGGFDRPGPAPFRTEGESFVALHHELVHCASVTFRYFTRTNRDPRRWKSAQLAKGYGHVQWVVKQKIGFPSHPSSPLRKMSWWFNGSLLQFQLLREAGVSFETLRPGAIQPAECR